MLIKSGLEVGEPAIPEDIGTISEIDEMKTLDDGRMVIVVEGQSRFRIVEIVEGLPYITAEVEVLQDDDAPDVDRDLMSEVMRAATVHLKLLMGLRGEWVRDPNVPTDPVGLRYFVGSQLQGDVIGKQGILESVDTRHALKLGLRLLDEESEMLRGQLDQQMRRSTGN